MISQEGAAPRVSGYLFKAVVQLVLLFEAENRLVTSRVGQVLGEFQDQVALRLTGRLLRRRDNGKWEYTLEEESREEEVFRAMEEYIQRR